MISFYLLWKIVVLYLAKKFSIYLYRIFSLILDISDYIIAGFGLYKYSRQEKENIGFELLCLLFQKDWLCDILAASGNVILESLRFFNETSEISEKSKIVGFILLKLHRCDIPHNI